MKIAFTILFFSFVLSALGRIQLTPTIAINLMDIIVGAISGVFLITVVIKKSFPKVIGQKPLLFFIGAAALSLIINSFHLPTNTLFEATLYLCRLFAYSFLYFIFSSQNEKNKFFLSKIMHISGYILVIGGYLQYFFYQNLRNLYYLGWDDHLYRLFSTFLDPNFAGVFFVLFFFFSFYRFIKLNPKSLLHRCMIIALLLSILGAILLSFSRTAYISLLLGAIMHLFLTGRKKLIMVLLGIAVTTVLLLSPLFGTENTNLFRKASSSARIDSLGHALLIIRHNPIFGVGFDAYRYTQIRYGFVPEHPQYPSHADAGTDNSYLFILATTGIIGFSVYGWFMVTLYRIYLKKKNTPETNLIIISLTVFLISGLFINSLFYTPFLLWLFSLLGTTNRT